MYRADRQRWQLCDLYLLVDRSVRSYVYVGEQLTPRHTVPAFTDQPEWPEVDTQRQSLLVSQISNSEDHEVSMCVLEASGWSVWRTLARDDSQHKLDFGGFCVNGPNSIALFDENSKSVKLYELA